MYQDPVADALSHVFHAEEVDVPLVDVLLADHAVLAAALLVDHAGHLPSQAVLVGLAVLVQFVSLALLMKHPSLDLVIHALQHHGTHTVAHVVLVALKYLAIHADLAYHVTLADHLVNYHLVLRSVLVES